MADTIDLNDLIPDLKAQVSAAGDNLLPNATNSQLLSQLIGGFWEAKLHQLLGAYQVDEDGVVTPDVEGSGALGRDLQQIIIHYAYIRILRAKMLNTNTLFRAKSGSQEIETQQSAQLLKAIYDDALQQRNIWLQLLSDLGHIRPGLVDAVIARSDSIASGKTWFTSSRTPYSRRGR